MKGTPFIRGWGLFFIVATLVLSVFGGILYSQQSKASNNQIALSSTAVMVQLVQKTNSLREQQGLRPLEASRSLELSAQAKLQEMGTLNYWGHYTNDGQSFSRFILSEKPGSQLVGENLARCFNGYDAAFEGLVNSPKHYAVLTGDFEYIGVASHIDASGCESIVMHVAR